MRKLKCLQKKGPSHITKTSLYKSVRWTIRDAAVEWGVSSNSLGSKLHAIGQSPGEDNKWGTTQICKAIYGDKAYEQTRLVREQADAKQVENLIAAQQLVKIHNVISYLKGVAISIRQNIQALQSIGPEEKDDICNELAALFENHTITDKVCPSED